MKRPTSGKEYLLLPSPDPEDGSPGGALLRPTRADLALRRPVRGDLALRGMEPDIGTAVLARVTRALLVNPPDRLTVIDVFDDEETIILQGEAASPETAERVEAAAAQHPEVDNVVNALTVQPQMEGK